jgi:2'-5' RNA ligase
METIRTFIALPLPDKVLAELDKLIIHMRPFGRDVKWVRPASIHLTLKFLGHLNPDQLAAVFSGMDRLFKQPESTFSLVTDSTGAFPDSRRPRVLWVGVEGGGISKLLSLQEQVEKIMAKEGFPEEKRKFSPHLTVGRFKMTRSAEYLMTEYLAYRFPSLEFTVKEVLVMKSELKPSGAVYSTQKRYRLSDTGE